MRVPALGRQHMFNEPDEPCMFDEIQMVVFASNDSVGKAFRVLDDNLRLCLICGNAFTRQGAAEHAERVRESAIQAEASTTLESSITRA